MTKKNPRMQGCKGGRAFWMKDSPGAITKVHSEPKALIQMVMIITLKWVWEDPLPLGKLRYQTGKNTTKWEKAFLPRNGRNSCHQEFPGIYICIFCLIYILCIVYIHVTYIYIYHILYLSLCIQLWHVHPFPYNL